MARRSRSALAIVSHAVAYVSAWATPPFSLSLGSLWLSGGRRIEVPPQSFYVATLVTSDVVTVIGGQEMTRHTGDSWSVPSGASMVVQLQGRSEGALLEVFRVEPNPPAR